MPRATALSFWECRGTLGHLRRAADSGPDLRTDVSIVLVVSGKFAVPCALYVPCREENAPPMEAIRGATPSFRWGLQLLHGVVQDAISPELGVS